MIAFQLFFVITEFDKDIEIIYSQQIVLNQSMFKFIISFRAILKQTTLSEYTV